MNWLDKLPIVREAVWLYDGTVPIRIRVRRSSMTYGSGDQDDAPEFANDQPIESFCVCYESAGSPGVFNNAQLNLPSLEEAIAVVDAKFPGAKWVCGDLPPSSSVPDPLTR
jgi:hypothetical protein